MKFATLLLLITATVLLLCTQYVVGWSCSTLNDKECKHSCACGLCDGFCINYASGSTISHCRNWHTGVGGSSCDEFYSQIRIWTIVIVVVAAVLLFFLLPLLFCKLCKKVCCCCCPC